MDSLVIDPVREAVQEIIAIGRLLSQRGWVAATSGNLSRRIDEDRVAITVSGVDKGELTEDKVTTVRLSAPATRGVSAETPLHLLLYRRDPAIGAVLHTHSLPATVVSRRHAGRDVLTFEGYELQKGIRGVRSHEDALRLPLFRNSQDMPRLADEVEGRLAGEGGSYGFVLEGHGLYAWGADMAEARRHLESYEFLLSCELERRRAET